MENFMIGHYGVFSSEKQERDFKKNFWGVEACLLQNEEEVEKLMETKKKNDFHIGIHFPLRSGVWSHRDPQYLSLNADTYKASYDYMNKELDYAIKIFPSYVLIHYPKPVVLDPRVDWHGWGWRFSHPTEFICASDFDKESFLKKSRNFFHWFSHAAKKYDFEPIIELDAIPPYLYEQNLLSVLLEEYPMIKVCADIGRLHLQDKIDCNFDPFAFLKSIKRHVTQVHLWNIKVADKVEYSHYPALPNLIVEDGWADIEKYFNILKQCPVKPRILFEHDSSQISKSDLESCYEWVLTMQKQGQ